jgi:hypothetical protein
LEGEEQREIVDLGATEGIAEPMREVMEVRQGEI